jgi:hypothetical protein
LFLLCFKVAKGPDMNGSRFFDRQAWCGLALLALLLALPSSELLLAADSCPFTCGDLNGDNTIDLADYSDFAGCMGQLPGASQECFCSDMDGSGTIDLRDFALLAVVFGQVSDEVPPGCSGALGSIADLTAYRPQHGAGYTQFARTAVDDADEDSATLGPGIRINAPGDTDPAGEDDLIEVLLTIDPPGAMLALRRSNAALEVWTTRDKQPGTDIAFTDNKTAALPFGPTESELTLWVEWASPTHGTADLHIEPPAAEVPKDTLTFHTFHGIVAALGGEDQVPSAPPDPNSGTFVIATDLYQQQGYDVHMYDEDNVSADGSGVVYDEIVNAVQNRGVDEVAIFGYSHGGGSTYSLSDRLDVNRVAIGVFDINFTSYVDAVGNSSDIDMSQELRRPPSTAYHLNHYQNGTFADFWLDGGPVPNSNPPPTGLDVETTPWGATSTHYEVDDFDEVLDLMESSLIPRVTR